MLYNLFDIIFAICFLGAPLVIVCVVLAKVRNLIIVGALPAIYLPLHLALVAAPRAYFLYWAFFGSGKLTEVGEIWPQPLRDFNYATYVMTELPIESLFMLILSALALRRAHTASQTRFWRASIFYWIIMALLQNSESGGFTM